MSEGKAAYFYLLAWCEELLIQSQAVNNVFGAAQPSSFSKLTQLGILSIGEG
jgi:hypothetical protein